MAAGTIRIILLFGAVASWHGGWAAEPLPSPQEQEHFLAAAREIALNYSKSLPDFICTQRVQRSARIPRPDGRIEWRDHDVLTVGLSYSASKGDLYTLRQINGRPTDLPYDSLGGNVSQGEFGSIFRGIFEPDAGAQFRFERWDKLGGRRVAVYSYQVPRGLTNYYLLQSYDEVTGQERQARTGLRGNLFIDSETNAVLRITAVATDIPLLFPIRSSDVTITYRLADIGGRRYLLPAEAVSETSTARTSHRNRIQFLNYSKFASDSAIQFERTDSSIEFEDEEKDKP